ncbi:hypothetical protein [Lachnoclostridium sp. An181]|uniref:hypothetical protein n=1 Tax=Lachnoclostridium sp. An181 TaxID=1965575 RepID=UPI000B36B8B2|nr:hypothetical protein [Lachnoclostridium sp. An181]OUP49746.1 hypothetical protein B5F18_06955 [Lachnoclostridium sp. An181]
MNDFYDLNDLVAFYLKKWKSVLAVIMIGAIAFAGVRLVSNIQQYKNQDENQVIKNQAEGEEPTWKRITYTVKVDDLYDIVEGIPVLKTKEITEAFLKGAKSESVMNELLNKYFEKEKQEDTSRKESFNHYGYILDKEKDYPYTYYDFMNQTIVEQDTNIENYVMIGFKSTDEELAEEIAKEYTDILIKHVNEIVKESKCEVVDKTLVYELPATSAGAVSSRKVDAAVNTVITKSSIVKQTIKGAIWGAMIAACLIIVVLFFIYYTSKKVRKYSDLKKSNIDILGVIADGKIGRYKKFIGRLEGNNEYFANQEEFAQYFCEFLKVNGISEGNILICGNDHKKKLTKFQEVLSEICRDIKIDFIYEGSLSISKEALRNVNNVSYAIIGEVFNKSLINSMEEEYKYCQNYNIKVLGLVAIE